MTIDMATDLQKRVERYVLALEELRAAHHDVREVLLTQVLVERWQQLGADLGFEAEPRHEPDQDVGHAHRDLAEMNRQIPELTESWSS
jgi:hypothetical protein